MGEKLTDESVYADFSWGVSKTVVDKEERGGTRKVTKQKGKVRTQGNQRSVEYP